MRRPILGVAVIGATISLLLTACTSGTAGAAPASSGDSGKPINVTIVYGITGAFSSFVGDFVVGAETARDTINKAGGVDGRPIELNILDDKSDPTQGVSIVTDLVNSGDLPDVIFPGGTSAETLAMLPVASGAGVLTLSSAVSPDTNKPDLYPYHFGTSPSQQDSLKVLENEFKSKGFKKVGVIVPGNATGDARLAGFQDLMDNAGIKIAQVERPAEDALNYDVEMQRLKDAGVDAIYFDFNPYDANARVLQSRVTVGATDIPIYGGITAGGAGLKNLVDPDAVEGCFVPVFKFTVDDGNLPKDLQPLYDATETGGNKTSIAAYGWDVVQLAALAVQRAGKDTSGEALTDALLSAPVPADLLGVFHSGATYTNDNRFPTLSVDDMAVVGCGVDQNKSGIWQVKK